MKNIRYSHAFKLHVVREIESGKLTSESARRKYDITGKTTVMKWVHQLGSGKCGKLIRVQQPDEIDELERLRREVRRAKEALADAHIQLALEKAYLEVACQQLDQQVETFKKKHAGKPRTLRSKPTRH
jgi:transposase-like protein